MGARKMGIVGARSGTHLQQNRRLTDSSTPSSVLVLNRKPLGAADRGPILSRNVAVVGFARRHVSRTKEASLELGPEARNGKVLEMHRDAVRRLIPETGGRHETDGHACIHRDVLPPRLDWVVGQVLDPTKVCSV